MEEEFEFEIKKINLIYFKARQSFEVFKYLSKRKVNSDSFWIQVMYLSFKDTVIELDKLFSTNNNQKFRIRKLFNKLKKSGNYKGYMVDETLILKWENELNGYENILLLINDLRDKHFAHTDRCDKIAGVNTSAVDYRNLLNIKDVEKLFDYIKKVMVEVLSLCKGEFLDLDLFFYERDIRIFEQLDKFYDYRRIEINEKLTEYKQKRKV
jgi:hypothetical protein